MGVSIVAGHAVCVGINHYRKYPKLKWAAGDATHLRDTLAEIPNSQFDSTRIALLTDDDSSADKPTLAVIVDTLTLWATKTSPDDVLLFYFAGHGLELDSQGFLVAQDSGYRAPESSLSLQQIVSILGQAPARRKILIIDACRANLNASGPEVKRSPAPFSKILLEHPPTDGNAAWEILTSCGPDQISWESDDLKAGLWTHSLISAIEEISLRGPVTVKDASKRALDLLQDVHVGLAKHNQTKVPHVQLPQYSVSGPANRASAILVASDGVHHHTERVNRSTETLLEAMKGANVTLLTNDETPLTASKRKPSERWRRVNLEMDRIKDSEDTATIHLVPYESRVDRTDLALDREYAGAVRSYPLRLYVPPLSAHKRPFNTINLMFHGLADSDPAVFDDIGVGFANAGAPALLIPYPGHMCRRSGIDRAGRDTFWPSSKEDAILASQLVFQEIVGDPARFVRLYHQVISDASNILRDIVGGQNHYWEQLFAGQLNVNVVGYSLGGFMAMAMMMLYGEGGVGDSTLRKLVLIESGAHLDQIRVGSLFTRGFTVQKILWDYYGKGERLLDDAMLNTLYRTGIPAETVKRDAYLDLHGKIVARNSEDEAPWRVFDRDEFTSQRIWHSIMVELYGILEEGKKSEFLEGQQRRAFQRIMFGYESLKYRDFLASRASDILVIAGGADEMFPTRLLLGMGPEAGFVLLQIPVNHWLRHGGSEDWERWRPFAVAAINLFVE